MEVKFTPSNYEPEGIISFRSWSDSKLQQAMRELFNESERETLVELVIEREGIKAKFKHK